MIFTEDPRQPLQGPRIGHGYGKGVGRALAGLLLATGLAACGAVGTQSPGPTAAPYGMSQTAPQGADQAGVGHTHGLGVDPATGKVYVAGHIGLFTIEDD